MFAWLSQGVVQYNDESLNWFFGKHLLFANSYVFCYTLT